MGGYSVESEDYMEIKVLNESDAEKSGRRVGEEGDVILNFLVLMSSSVKPFTHAPLILT